MGGDGGRHFTLRGWGDTWSAARAVGIPEGPVIGIIGTPSGLLACQKRFLFQSKDGGETWQATDTSEFYDFIAVRSRNDTLVALYTLFNGDSPDGYRYSTDEGETWKSNTGASMPRAATGDTLLFGGSEYLWAEDRTYIDRLGAGPAETVFTAKQRLKRVGASSTRLFALVGDGYCLASRTGKAPWSFVQVKEAEARILSLAADSGRVIAAATPRGISYSTNGGRDWEFLRMNPHGGVPERVGIGGGMLYVHGPGDALLYRYDLSKTVWDSVPLPGTGREDRIAASGNLVAHSLIDETGSLQIHVSGNRGVSFAAAGKSFAVGSGGYSTIFSGDTLFLISRSIQLSADTGRNWKTYINCCLPSISEAAAMDSGFILADGAGRLKHVRSNHVSFEAFETFESPDDSDSAGRNNPALAGSGGSLYYGNDAGLWVWEEARVVGIGNSRRPNARAKPPGATGPRAGFRGQDDVYRDALGAILPKKGKIRAKER